jgi:hypothetical protein
MLFLAIFGKNVEDAFGPLLYLGLLLRRDDARPGGDVAPGPGGTSRTPGARALHCVARGILPSPHRKTQDAGAEMRIGFVSGKIKIVIGYQY